MSLFQLVPDAKQIVCDAINIVLSYTGLSQHIYDTGNQAIAAIQSNATNAIATVILFVNALNDEFTTNTGPGTQPAWDKLIADLNQLQSDLP